MVGSTNVVALIAYLVVGLVIGWGVLVIRDDIRIKKDNKWRRIRAVFLASICVLFAIAVLFVNTLGFLVCSAGCLVVLAYAVRKRNKSGA
jgi:NhaP-type Na+/H+ or K+/H+ antiporter